MPRSHLVATVLLALVLGVAIACNGDDDDGNGTPDDGTTATATPANGDSPGDGTLTPAPDKTPVNGGGDVPAGDGQPSNDDGATPAPGATAATLIDNIVVWLETNYPTVSPPREDCVFNPGTFITTCPGHGEYSVDPPLTGEDVSCQSLLVNGEPVALTCTSQNPLQTIYYEVQQ